MRQILSRWSEDETLGKALILAGVIILAVQVMPRRLLAALVSLWPLAIVVIGVGFLMKGRNAPRPEG